MELAVIEKSLVWILRNPMRVYDSTATDTKRREAALAFHKLDVGVYVGRRPPNAPASKLAITIERQGGASPVNIDVPTTRRWPIVDFTTWGRVGADHEGLDALLRAGLLMEILLHGLRGTYEGVSLCINRDNGDPFQADETSGDGSDLWISSYTYPFLVQYEGTTATHRVA